jgi:hypothetical protein
MSFELIINKSNNIPFIPIYLSKYNEYSSVKNLNIFLSKYFEYFNVDDDYLENIKNNENIKIVEIIKNNKLFGYIGILKNKDFFKNTFYWKWNIIIFNENYNEEILILDNIISNSKNDNYEYITIREIYKILFKD